MLREVNLERFDIALNAIEESNNSKYSIDEFVRQEGIYYKPNGNYILLKCFSNSDNNPSMKVNTVDNEYKCFSCGHSGKFINFVSDYYESIGKMSKTSVIIDNYLKEDSELQSKCGFKTIYVNKKDSIDLIIGKLKEESNRPMNFKPVYHNNLQVVNHLTRVKKLSLADKKSLIYYIQEGLMPDEIYNIFNNIKEETYSLEGVVNG